jgi:hypothetical protein
MKPEHLELLRRLRAAFDNIYLWTFTAWVGAMAVGLVLLVPVRLYAWLRDWWTN